MLSKGRFQALLKFSRKKERAETGQFIVEGWRWLEEALSMPEPPECVLAVPRAARSAAEAGLLEQARAVSQNFEEVSPEQLARLTDNVSSPGVAALVRWRPAKIEVLDAAVAAEETALVLALDAVSDPGNAGSIVRTADWFAAAGVLFGPGSVEPSNPKTVRSTMASLLHVPVVTSEDLVVALERLKLAGFAIVGAALDGSDLYSFAWPQRCTIVIGNEANGIRREAASALDHRVRIPAFGRAESLNAAVAAAILAADWRRHFLKPELSPASAKTEKG